MSLAGRDNFADRQKRKEKHMMEQEGDGGIVAKVYLRMAKADAAIVIMVITFYVLFGDDIRLALTGKSADGAFDALNVISLFVFLFELAVTYAADPKYRFSFYFWVDFVAIITMVPDITFCGNRFLTPLPDKLEVVLHHLQTLSPRPVFRAPSPPKSSALFALCV